MLLGAIADDFTGATDLCSMLVRGGMRTVQLIGVPQPGDPAPDADAVVVALKSRTAPVRQAVERKPRRARLAARGRLPAVLLQILLDLRQHRCRQYRPGRRCADRSTRLRLRARLPGVSRQCAQRLSGLSVRRRHAAERKRHGAPSADADDRRQPGARAVAADRRHGRPGSVRNRRAGRRGDPPGDDSAEGAGPPLRHRRCGERCASDRDRRGRRASCADHRRFRRRDGTAGEFPPRRPAAGTSDAASLPACVRSRRGARRFVFARDAGAARHGARTVPVLQLDPIAQPDTAAHGRDRARLDGGQARRHADRHRRIGAARQGADVAADAGTRRRRRADRADAGAYRRGPGRARRAAAGGRRRRDRGCRGVASWRAQPAHRRARSIPACRGPMPKAARRRCCWR